MRVDLTAKKWMRMTALAVSAHFSRDQAVTDVQEVINDRGQRSKCKKNKENREKSHFFVRSRALRRSFLRSAGHAKCDFAISTQIIGKTIK